MDRIKKRWVMLCFCSMAFLLGSCGNNDKKNTAEETDTLSQNPVQTKTPATPDLQKVFQNPGLAKWKTRMKKTYPRFSTANFNQKEKQPLQPHPAQKYTEKKWQTFQPYFIPSPNHSKAVDLYSYGTIPSDSGKIGEGGEPDSEVNLVNLSGKTKTRLLFAGPGTTFQQAEWLNDSIIIVTGESDANKENIKLPALWQINIYSHAVTEYSYRDSVPSKH